ncbi:MAG: phosphatase PAP2 family protein [Capsulimonadaceae bacterium]
MYVSRIICDWTNPVLTILLLMEVIRLRYNRPLSYACASTASISISVAIAELSKYYVILPHHPGFPSGHASWCISTCCCLMYRERRWAWVLIPVIVAMCFCLVIARWHVPIDIFGAALISPVPPIVILTGWARFGARRQPTGN